MGTHPIFESEFDCLTDNMTVFDDAVNGYAELSKEFKGKSPNLEKCGSVLEKLKICLVKLSFLPNEKGTHTKELVLARDIIEMGALYSIASRDIPAFSRYIAQLKSYYFDYKNLPKSYFRSQLLGLNLLCLLAQNKVSEFHTEIERLEPGEIHDDIYIKHPIQIEQYLMEGNYNKLFLAQSNIPSESYSYFIEILLETIRAEIGSCLEKAYANISVAEAQRMLYFKSAKDLQSYGASRKWTLNRNEIHFPKEADGDSIPSKDVTRMMLGYACELEMII